MLEDKKTVFTGKIVAMETAKAHLPNGHSMEVDIVRHPGGAAVVALNEQNRVCMLKQYRCVFDQWIWELPAGKIDHNEPPFDTAQRELEEEAGVRASSWTELGYMISSPGVFTEKVYLYLARELQTVPQDNEDHEVFEVHWLEMKEILEWAKNGKISDAKTVIGIYRAADIIGLGEKATT